MPTLTLPRRPADTWNTHKVAHRQYTGPASYVTGGDALVAQDVKLGTLDLALFEPATDGTNIYALMYDLTNAKVVWYDPSTAAEPAAATDLSGFSAQGLFIGK